MLVGYVPLQILKIWLVFHKYEKGQSDTTYNVHMIQIYHSILSEVKSLCPRDLFLHNTCKWLD